jgi:hypothetical protein
MVETPRRGSSAVPCSQNAIEFITFFFIFLDTPDKLNTYYKKPPIRNFSLMWHLHSLKVETDSPSNVNTKLSWYFPTEGAYRDDRK